MMNRCSRRPLVASSVILLLTMLTAASPVWAQCRDPLECELIPLADWDGEINDEGEFIDPLTGTVLVQRPVRLKSANLAVSGFLGLLDIDGDGVPDGAPDTDGDGLPDNWEQGGFEALAAGGEKLDRIVFFPAPTAIVPGTPPTPIFTRLAVATDALNPDTDGDGISDFIEVFGLMFIDEDRNGLLDLSEWNDENSDGLPSPGEFPLDNTGQPSFTIPPDNPDSRFVLIHDFDGFVFTDPTNADTDGDGKMDGVDNDPLINPRAFGNESLIIVKFNAEGNEDVDGDGLGNGMDLGNDLTSADGAGVRDFQILDNPLNAAELLNFFRRDLLSDEVIPEAAIEDLLGADWDGNGLWRTTDVRIWSIVIDPEDPERLPPSGPFTIGTHNLYTTQTFDDLADLFNGNEYDGYGERGIGLGWQDLLRPSGRTEFLPDPEGRVWAVLYSWRMPGFDIDGDGFVGSPNISTTASYVGSANVVPPHCDPSVAADSDTDRATTALRETAPGRLELSDEVAIEIDRQCLDPEDSNVVLDRAFDDRIGFELSASPTDSTEPDPTKLDGRIVVPPGFSNISCGAFGLIPVLLLVVGLGLTRMRRRRR